MMASSVRPQLDVHETSYARFYLPIIVNDILLFHIRTLESDLLFCN